MAAAPAAGRPPLRGAPAGGGAAVPRRAGGLDLAGLVALADERAAAGAVGPCNRRCSTLGRCAFGRAPADAHWCRERPGGPEG